MAFVDHIIPNYEKLKYELKHAAADYRLTQA